MLQLGWIPLFDRLLPAVTAFYRVDNFQFWGVLPGFALPTA